MLTPTQARQDHQKRPLKPDGPPCELVTVRDVAKTLGVSRRTVERLVARGELPFYEIPIRGGLRFDLNAISDWMARRHRSTLE